jgi:DNA-binding XRE family transcriptional regulator
MNAATRKRLEADGWVLGSIKEFLGLSDEEATLVEIKLALSKLLKEQRAASGISQVDLAQRIGSSQSRIAKLEAVDPSASVDLLMRAALGAGATAEDIAKAMSKSPSVRRAADRRAAKRVAARRPR